MYGKEANEMYKHKFDPIADTWTQYFFKTLTHLDGHLWMGNQDYDAVDDSFNEGHKSHHQFGQIFPKS